MALDLEHTEVDGQVVIKAAGDVDLYSSPKLRDALLKAIPKAGTAVGIDLSEVGYMDSSGVATLVEGLKLAGAKKKTFKLLAPSSSVMKVLKLSRLDAVFTIEESS
jgi:anti-sigma B factor antagonist